jgi:hypothetical protein
MSGAGACGSRGLGPTTPAEPRAHRARLRVAASVLAWALMLTGCAQAPQPPAALVDMLALPAEKTLLAGLRAYDDALYIEAERHFLQALQLNLAAPKDRAAAHKHLAFIYCTSHRRADCEAQFRAARLADPAFTLSKSEAGHPSWSEVYKRIRP